MPFTCCAGGQPSLILLGWPPFALLSLNIIVNHRDLVRYYQEDVKGLSARETKKRREFWHYAAKRWLIFHRLTGDDAGKPPSHYDTINGQKYCISEAVLPFWPFWFQWSQKDLIELYRETKPPRSNKSPSA